ncbi:MbcA/ParS/Xre antitoxin family protein [Paracoccus sp. NSM]|uniref:MbcA/ParS/Xre antitoxin family protein n=1 Tax=Paracoccus sp. NSM TaxID=3457784 RepID=UPI004035C8EB
MSTMLTAEEGSVMHRASVPSVSRQPEFPAVTDEEAAALARTIVNLFRAWDLTDGEARVLLGDMDERTWGCWKTGDTGLIDRNLCARLAILMGIHKALRTLFTEPDRGYKWIRQPSAALGAQSALDIMMRGKISDLLSLRAYLDAELGV